MILSELLPEERKFVESIKDSIFVELPFTTQELTDNILVTALNGALSDLNRFLPRVVEMNSYGGDTKSSTLLRSYTNELDSLSFEPYIEELGYGLAMEHQVAVDWTLTSVQYTSLSAKYFKDLTKYRAAMYMANIRRSATMNNLPFDIKGDQFYEEFKESYNNTLLEMQNNNISTY